LFFTAIPFIVFSLVDLVQHNKKGIPFKKTAISLILSLAVAIAGLAISPSTKDNTEIAKESPQIVQETPTTTTETETKQENSQVTEQENSQSVEQNTNASATLQEKTVSNDNKGNSASIVSADKELKVHFIDVGQGDSIFIHTNSAAMLIDAGNNGDGSKIVNYIKKQGYICERSKKIIR